MAHTDLTKSIAVSASTGITQFFSTVRHIHTVTETPMPCSFAQLVRRSDGLIYSGAMTFAGLLAHLQKHKPESIILTDGDGHLKTVLSQHLLLRYLMGAGTEQKLADVLCDDTSPAVLTPSSSRHAISSAFAATSSSVLPVVDTNHVVVGILRRPESSEEWRMRQAGLHRILAKADATQENNSAAVPDCVVCSPTLLSRKPAKFIRGAAALQLLRSYDQK